MLFCGKITNAGVYCIKHHLAGAYRAAKPCPRCPPEIIQGIQEFMEKKKEQMQMSPGIDDFHLEDDVVEIEAKLNLLRAIKAPFLNLTHKSRRLKGLRMYSTH